MCIKRYNNHRLCMDYMLQSHKIHTFPYVYPSSYSSARPSENSGDNLLTKWFVIIVFGGVVSTVMATRGSGFPTTCNPGLGDHERTGLGEHVGLIGIAGRNGLWPASVTVVVATGGNGTDATAGQRRNDDDDGIMMISIHTFASKTLYSV